MNVDVSYPLDTLSWPLKVKVKPEGQGQISNIVFFFEILPYRFLFLL